MSDSHVVLSQPVRPVRTAPLYDLSPTPPPYTVMLADPDPAPLLAPPELNDPAPDDSAAVTLPDRHPPLADTRRLPIAPPPTWHRSDVSDSQLVLSHIVSPCRTAVVYAPDPSPDPCKLTLAEPVTATFTRLSTLAPPTSPDNAVVTLPTRPPMLTATRRLCPPSPPPPRHTTDDSDIHPLASLDDPVRKTALPHVAPSCPPHIVTLADPVPATFTPSTTLILAPSTEYASDELPPLAPTLKSALRLPTTPAPSLQRTLVSDFQPVASHAVPPARIASEYPTSPNPPPATVTLVDPLAPPFSLRAKLTAPLSVESIVDPVPTPSPRLSDTRRLPHDPSLIKLRADESDSQVVASLAVCPIRPAPVDPETPRLAPCTVTLSEPDAAAFHRLILLASGTSVDSATDTVPPPTTKLTRTPKLPSPDCPDWHRTPDSDSHAVLSHAEGPMLTLTVYDPIPSDDPYSVKLADPEPAPFVLDTVLRPLSSLEIMPLTLPTRAPELTISTRVLLTPCPALHTTALSADHVLCSHSVRPARTPPVIPASPVPLPCTVTLAAPDDAWFARLPALNALRPMLKAPVTLPAFADTVTTLLRLPASDCPARPCTEVSDPHALLSAALSPIRRPVEYAAPPRYAPYAVTLAAPVAPWFARLTTLAAPAAVDSPDVMLPTRPPAVISPRALPVALWLGRDCTDDSDVQLVSSAAVVPMRTAPLIVARPSPLPCTVSADDPVEARFLPSTELIATRFVENTPVTLPSSIPTLTKARMLPLTLCPPLQRTDVSDSQLVRSHPVCPAPDPGLYPPSPTPRPDTVTLDDPVPPTLLAAVTLRCTMSPET